MIMDKNTFTVINNEGKETTCYVLFTFDSEETNKSYGNIPPTIFKK